MAATGDSSRYPNVRSPISLGSVVLPHRILTGSMHLNFETTDDGGKRLATFYRERARGGAALIITGGVAVSRVGAGGAEYSVVDGERDAERWQTVVDAVHSEGSRIALQLFHAGRYAFEAAFGLTPVAPSAVYSRFSRCEPREMTEAMIRETVDDFASGAAFAAALGFDGIEIMASEGYLLNQFASPITNLRDDDWGGDAERRRRFPVEVVRAVRAASGALPLIVRVSGADLVEGSSGPDEADALAIAVVEAGADALDIGIGWHESRVPTVQSMVPHGVWVDVAARIRRAVQNSGYGVPVIASNRINSVEQAESILAAGSVDMISMSRPFLADPRILTLSFAGRPGLVNTCIGCNEACIDRSIGSEAVSCLVNPRAGREDEFPEPVVAAGLAGDAGTAPPRVLVVGAGPAGMEAARALAVRGVRVTIREAGERIGGQFLMAGAVPGKEDFLETVRYFENELPRLGVRIELGAEVRAASDAEGYDHVIVATGVEPRAVDIPGIESSGVIDYAQAFADIDSVGGRVAVIGAGGIGVDLAHLLAAHDGEPATSDEDRRRRFLVDNGLADGPSSVAAREVTLMRRSGSIGAGMGATTRWAVVQALRASGVRTLSGVAYSRIDADGVLIEHEGTREFIPADTVIVAAGPASRLDVVVKLASAGIPHTVIGGADASEANAVMAFEQGLRAGARVADLVTGQYGEDGGEIEGVERRG